VHVRRHQRKTFLAQVQAFLVEDEAMNNLLLGLGHTLSTNPDAYPLPPYLASIRDDEDGGRIALVALRTPPFQLAVSTCARSFDVRQVVDALVADLRSVSPTLPGVAGPKAVVDAFVPRWQAVSGQEAELAVAERIYELTRVVPPPAARGRMRMAGARDRDLLVDWLGAFAREATPDAPDTPAEAVDRRLATPGAAFYLWEDGEPVSLVGHTGPTPTGMRIGPVYTPPMFRGRGYAGALVAAVSQQLLDAGRQRCFLYTDLANPTSNALYQRIGYRPVGDVDQYRLWSR
jgi:predicted GNAT family acetyltransferase